MPPSSASSSLKIYFNQETKISEIWEWFYTVEISTFFFAYITLKFFVPGRKDQNLNSMQMRMRSPCTDGDMCQQRL